MAYRFVVDYIKQIIKDRVANGNFKFMALAFLKEVIKTNDPTLANYLATKILKRLYQLTIAPEGEKCLTIYDKKVNLADSAKFHYLLRECFTNWGSKFKTVNKNYMIYTKKLAKKGLVPAPQEKWWNFPAEAALHEELRGNSIMNDFSAEGLSRNDSRLEGSDISRSRSPSPNVQRPSDVNAPLVGSNRVLQNSSTRSVPAQSLGGNPVRSLIRHFVQRFKRAAGEDCPKTADGRWHLPAGRSRSRCLYPGLRRSQNEGRGQPSGTGIPGTGPNRGERPDHGGTHLRIHFL
jgi:hypothetical protein